MSTDFSIRRWGHRSPADRSCRERRANSAVAMSAREQSARCGRQRCGATIRCVNISISHQGIVDQAGRRSSYQVRRYQTDTVVRVSMKRAAQAALFRASI